MHVSQPLKVTQILEATGGGTRRHLRDIVRRLDPAAFELSVICSEGREADFSDDVDWMRGRGVAVRTMPMATGVSPLADALAVGRVYRLLRELTPEVVHTHSTKAGWIGRLAARSCGVRKIVHTPHCWPFEIEAPRSLQWLVAGIERRLSRGCDAIVCVSEAEREAALRRRVAPPGRLTVIANGIDLSLSRTLDAKRLPPALKTLAEQRQRHGWLTIAIVGRLCRQKGQLDFLDAVAPLLGERDDLRVVLIGDGPLRRRIEQRCDQLDIAHRCTLAGHVGDPRVLYSLFDIVAIPSRWEGMPYVLLDAMAAERAVVAYDVGGIAQALADGAGVVVAKNDRRALTTALRRLIEEPAYRLRLAAQARAAVGRYDVRRMTDALADVYRAPSRPPA